MGPRIVPEGRGLCGRDYPGGAVSARVAGYSLARIGQRVPGSRITYYQTLPAGGRSSIRLGTQIASGVWREGDWWCLTPVG
jgi:hypothetical protein